MSSDLPAVSEESPETRVRAKHYQLTAIAQMASQGHPTNEIADAIGLPERYINRLLGGGASKKFDEEYANCQESMTKLFVGTRFKMAEHLHEALKAVKRGIASNDLKLATDNAWRLLEYLLPSQNQKGGDSGRDGALNITFNNPQVRATIGDGVESVATMLHELKNVIGAQSGPLRVLEGADALPTPAAQLAVTEAPTELHEDVPVEIEVKPGHLPAILAGHNAAQSTDTDPVE